MTQILFDLKETSPQGDVPIDAQINCYPVARRKDGTVLVTRRGFTERTGFKPVVIDLHHTGVDGAWLITISSHNNDNVHGFYAVPAPVMVDGVEVPKPFNDLIMVDPDSLEPSEDPDPIWWAMARSTVTGGSVDGNGDLILTHHDGKITNAGRVKGDRGERGLRGLPGRDGTNGLNGADGLNDVGVANLIQTPTSETASALSAAIYGSVDSLRNTLPVNLLDFAVADGTDQTANIQTALDVVPVGGTLEVPSGFQFRIDGQVNVSRPVTVSSPGRGGFYSNASGAQHMVSVTSSYVRFRGLLIAGPQYATAITQRGIYVNGVAGAHVTDIEVTDCEVKSWAHHGVWLAYADNVSVTGNTVRDMGYAGIGLLSVRGGLVRGNNVRSVIQASGYVNSYGIHMSRSVDSSDLVINPRTSDVVVEGNSVSGVPNWAGIDTHGGQNIVITGNTVSNCRLPITAVSAKNGAGALVYAPLEINISGNNVASAKTDGTANSVHIIGNSTQKGTGTIRGNIIRGHGLQNAGGSGAIQIEYTRGVVIDGNVIVEPSPMGIVIITDNEGFVCTGNTIIDPWSNSILSKAIMCTAGNNTGHISRNVLISTGKASSYPISTGLGVAIANSAGNIVQVGDNSVASAGTPIYDPGAKTRFAAFGSPGAAKAASPGTATGTDADVLNALVTALRNYGIVT